MARITILGPGFMGSAVNVRRPITGTAWPYGGPAGQLLGEGVQHDESNPKLRIGLWAGVLVHPHMDLRRAIFRHPARGRA